LMTRRQKPALENTSCQVDHAADYYSRYPGEAVTFYSRMEVGSLEQFTARITLPPGLSLQKALAVSQPIGVMPIITADEGSTHVIWNVQRQADSPNVFEYQTETVVLPTERDEFLDCRAVLSAEPADAEPIYLDERVSVAVKTKGRLLKYLPSIYHDDDLMSRLLMLFESFLAPIEKQINTQQYYLDPRMTPPEFLNWLSSWVGLVLDEDITEQRRRRLLVEAARLYRLRGTRRGLVEYLEIISGGKVEVVEHFSENFCLGPESFMGPGIALGKENIPNTFGVRLLLPPLRGDVSEEEKARWRMLWERKTQAIIEAEKPVHSGYDLSLEYDPDLG
jgi:phage tail-like protein